MTHAFHPALTLHDASACACCARVREIEKQSRDILNSQEEFHLVSFTGAIVDCNQSFADSIGRTRDEVLAMPLGQIDPSPPERLGTLIKSIVDLGSYRFHSQHRHRDGHFIDVEVSAHIIFLGEEKLIAAFSHPITEQLRAARALYESEQKIRILFANSASLLCMMNPHGVVLECNQTMLELFGRSGAAPVHEVLSSAAYFGADAKSAATVSDMLRRAQSDEVRGEVTHTASDGESRTFELRIKPIQGETGSVTTLIAEGTDISQRKRAEAERLALQAQIIATQEAMIAELSTPLIPLEEGVMVMPLVGKIDERRAQQVIERLLDGVSAQRVRTVIIDITGVAQVDASIASTLIRATQAARLLGAQAILSGIGPDVAKTLVALQLDLGKVVTCASLQSGLQLARKLRNPNSVTITK